MNQYGHTGLLFHPMGSFFHCRCAPPALAAADFPFAAAMHVPLPPTCTLSLFNQKKTVASLGILSGSLLGSSFLAFSFYFLLFSTSFTSSFCSCAGLTEPPPILLTIYSLSPSLHRCSIITFWCAPPPLPSILGANAMASRHCMTAGFTG